MEKECPICGMLFDTNISTQKYCDKCKLSKNAKRDVTYMKYRIEKSKSNYKKPNLISGTCYLCGKEFTKEKSIAYNKCRYDRKLFCSTSCRDKYWKSTLICRTCKKPIGDLPDVEVGKNKNLTHFCSPECKRQYLDWQKSLRMY